MKKKLSWVPNALSLGNLTFGFVSILIALETTGNPNASQMFSLAGAFILIAAVFDGFDGIVARALDATSEIGAELDTLADLTTFGIAPGVLMYKMVLSNIRIETIGLESAFPFGMMIAAVFPVCAAYRLARFTVTHDPGSFTGLPSPIAGVLVALFPMSFYTMGLPAFITVTTFICVALLMVSNIKYSKPQMAMRGKLSRGKLLFMFLGIAIIFILAGSKIPYILYGVIAFYIFSGIISFIIHLIQEL